MPIYPGTAMPAPLPSALGRPTLQHRLARAHPLIPAADAQRNPANTERAETGAGPQTASNERGAPSPEAPPAHERTFDQDAVRATVRGTLDRMPLADTVDNLTAALRWHIERLVPVVEAKDWARHGQGEPVGLILGAVRALLDNPPKPGAVAVVRAVYAQELARACRELLSLGLTEPGDDQRTAAP
jgi:Family of unknown function (DUF6415)